MPNQKPRPAQANDSRVKPATSSLHDRDSPQPSQTATDPETVARAAEKQQLKAATMQTWLNSDEDRLQWFISHGGSSSSQQRSQ